MHSPPIHIFVGPSIEAASVRRAAAGAILLPPVRRGDLALLPDDAVVGMIDGVFGQQLAVSPTEILHALARGIRIMGSSSMGALRAAELHDFGMVGVGRVFQMYSTGVIDGDDEVALVFDEATMRALSVPLVNVRHAVERLTRPGTIDHAIGQRILDAACRIPYDERDYTLVLREAGLADNADVGKLRELLESHDLKRNDAIVLLDTIHAFAQSERVAPRRQPTTLASPDTERKKTDRSRAHERPDAPVYLWDFGQAVELDELLDFLRLTGRFCSVARRALARFSIAGGHLDLGLLPECSDADKANALNQRFAELRADWGMHTEQEGHQTLRRLGVGLAELELTLEEDRVVAQLVAQLARTMPDAFAHAIRGELFSNDLQLKREVARCISLRTLCARARTAGLEVTPQHLADARTLTCEMVDVSPYRAAVQAVQDHGVSAATIDTMVRDIALVRMFARQHRARRKPRTWQPSDAQGPGKIRLRSREKVPGSRRNTTTLAFAESNARRIGEAIGVTRVGSITRLSPIGIPAAQAFRPGTGWSSTIGGGKSTSEQGAVVGALMEEIEKFAQDEFRCDERRTVTATYDEIRQRGPAVDPTELPLPNDGPYHPQQSIRWFQCHDLLSDELVWAPTAVFSRAREPLDIRYSEMRGDIFFSSNGLASAFSLEQAVHHALCEVVERHATMLAQLRLLNPGTDRVAPLYFIDPATLPPPVAELFTRVHDAGYRTRVMDISACGIAVLWVMLFEPTPSGATRFGYDVRRHDGFCAHVDPVAATQGAFLEAAQTVVVNVAGAREDLVIKARSLGRHERSATRRSAVQRALLSVNAPLRSIAAVTGAANTDALDDIRRCLDQLHGHGVRRVLCVDYSTETIAPAHVVRVVIPGLESDNPLHTGVRAHLAQLDGLIPAE